MIFVCKYVAICYNNVVSFFFFKQKTAYEMRISDWSSDVCSSDLAVGAAEHGAERLPDRGKREPRRERDHAERRIAFAQPIPLARHRRPRAFEQFLGMGKRHAGEQHGEFLTAVSGDEVIDADVVERGADRAQHAIADGLADRKTTRLNSSH